MLKEMNVIRVMVLALVLVPAARPGVASASGEMVTIDFEQFESGQIISAVPHAGSDRMIRVRGVNPRFEDNAAVIFDSLGPGVEDSDLGSPNDDFDVVGPDGEPQPGPGQGRGGSKDRPCQNDRPLGKLLIVEHDLEPLTEDGRVATPDDEGRVGAKIQMDFSELGSVTIHGLAVIDVEEPDADVRFYSVPFETRDSRKARKELLARYRVHTENNGVARLFDPELRNVPEAGCRVNLVGRRRGLPLEPIAGVRSLEVAFNGSGAIVRIIYSVDPTPASRRRGAR